MNEHDVILLERCSTTGDSQSFMEIVTRYQGMVYGVCLRILRDHSKAEDIVQEIFLKLTKSRPKASHALGPFLHRVATNNAISYLRSYSRRKARETKYMDQRSIAPQSGMTLVRSLIKHWMHCLKRADSLLSAII
jgi:RNA polymerase sigma-70 factor, ECF subfamily